MVFQSPGKSTQMPPGECCGFDTYARRSEASPASVKLETTYPICRVASYFAEILEFKLDSGNFRQGTIRTPIRGVPGLRHQIYIRERNLACR